MTKFHIEGFDADIEVLADESIVMHRRIHREQPTVDIDAFGRGWLYGEAELAPDQVAFCHAKRIVRAPTRLQVLIRDFSIVEWRLAAGSFTFDMFYSSQPLPQDIAQRFPRYAAMFTADADKFPDSWSEAVALLRRASSALPIDKCDTSSSRATRLKRQIERRFRDEILITDLARELGIPPAQASRAFKAQYGITIVNYLNQVRTADSMKELILGHASATEAGYGSGFNQYKQYFVHFRRQTKARPSDFSIKH